MHILIFGLVIFFIAIAVHIAIWRRSLPKRGINMLFKIFIVTFFAVALTTPLFSRLITSAGYLVPHSLYEYMKLAMIVASLAVAYTISYSAVEADSPSVTIMDIASRSGDNGVSEEELNNVMADGQIITPRIEDLLNDGLTCVGNDKYKLTDKGRMFVYSFILYRKLLGIPKGG